ncbi:MAG: tRNA glutamyl-Q(34) synthetase GluQRS [Pseudomonadales bacterium]
MTEYIGRFAPSPTGLLHIGSLIGALASYLDAKANKGLWLVRIEDLDPPREMPGAASAILNSLQHHGMHWDGEVLWQSQRHIAYRQVIEQLLDTGQAFYCTCSRNDLQTHAGIYPGTCRGQQLQPNQKFAIRLQVDDKTVSFDDAIQGHFSQQLQQQVGDVVLQRKDGLFAYQLAVVVDDAYQGISHIVRGSDLLDSTARQAFLQQVLGFITPHYAHFPVITNQQGQKLSKQTLAEPLCAATAYDNVLKALAFLNQPPPPTHLHKRLEETIAWATAHWSPENISNTLGIAEAK